MDNNSSQVRFFLIITSTVAALGGFLFGYDTGIISGALVFIRQSYPITTFMQEIVVSSVIFGALIGSLLSGRLADLFGSKSMLIYMALTFIFATLITTFATTIHILILGRFFIGVAIGITSYLSPLFISEMAPAKNRGALVLLNGIMITSGEAIAFLVDYALVPTQSWRLMFATGLIPAILLFAGMLMLPNSPRWLTLKGRFAEAKNSLLLMRKSQHVDLELNDIISSIKTTKNNLSELFSKSVRPVLIIGIGLGMFQQFVGINTVMYYGPSIFKAAGFESQGAQILATFGMGLVNTLMTIIAVFIIDRVGRRLLLLSGLLIAGISLAMVGLIFHFNIQSNYASWFTFIFMMFYIAGYSLSVGSLFWLVIAEIYPLHIRGLAMSFVTAIQWAANFLVALTFLSILNSLGSGFTFAMYSLMCTLSIIFCYCLVPETRGVSLEQIEENLRAGRRLRELGQPLLREI